MSGGCGEGACADCHSITKEEAANILGPEVELLRVDFAEMPGVWVADVRKGDREFPLYIDFSKQYILMGNILRAKDKSNVTKERQLSQKKVKIEDIPLADAIVIGQRSAPYKVVVFSDPECPYCQKFHQVMKKIVTEDPDVAFFIKLYPLTIHENSKYISKSILCNPTLETLDLAFSGKIVPLPMCETDQLDKNIALVQSLGINTTPSIILPNGRLLQGAPTADQIVNLIKNP